MRIFVPENQKEEFDQAESDAQLAAIIEAWPRLSWWSKQWILLAVRWCVFVEFLQGLHPRAGG